MVEPQKTREIIEQEAQAIWHITELLGKIGVSDDEDGDGVTLSPAALQHFSKQISNGLTHIMEKVDKVFPAGT